jgi:hypothetical protein
MMHLTLQLDDGQMGLDRQVTDVQQLVDWLRDRFATRDITLVEARVNYETILIPTPPA